MTRSARLPEDIRSSGRPVAFTDHFAPVAATYAASRPRYPGALLDWIAALAPTRRLAWDCATGNGQVALDLLGRFDRVIASDASADQLAAAARHPRVHYCRARAEASGLRDGSVDLVTVAQALHWLDLPRFHAEVRRVLAPEGILAVWTYGRLEVADPAIADCLDAHYHAIIGPFWPSRRRHVEDGYRSLEFPFPEISAPRFELTDSRGREELLGYLGSASAVVRYRAVTGKDPMPEVREALRSVWPVAEDPCRCSWPLTVRVGRRPGEHPERGIAPADQIPRTAKP